MSGHSCRSFEFRELDAAEFWWPHLQLVRGEAHLISNQMSRTTKFSHTNPVHDHLNLSIIEIQFESNFDYAFEILKFGAKSGSPRTCYFFIWNGTKRRHPLGHRLDTFDLVIRGMAAQPLFQSESSVPLRQDPSKLNKALMLPPFGASSLATRTSGQQQFTRDCLYFSGGRIWAMDWLQHSATLPGLLL